MGLIDTISKLLGDVDTPLARRTPASRRARKPTSGKWKKIIIMGPCCVPIKAGIESLLKKYGVASRFGQHGNLNSDGGITSYMQFPDPDKPNSPCSVGQYGELWVKEQQAEWAEYLILRQARWQLGGSLINARNAITAAKHAGKMPAAWIDKDCKKTVA